MVPATTPPGRRVSEARRPRAWHSSSRLPDSESSKSPQDGAPAGRVRTMRGSEVATWVSPWRAKVTVSLP